MPARNLSIVVVLVALAGCGGGKGSGGSSQPSPFTLAPQDGSTLPQGTVGAVYSTSFSVVAGGTAPYTIIPVGIPPGLALTSSGSLGTLSGTPTQDGTGLVAFEVRDSATPTNRANQAYLLTIQPAPGAQLTLAPATLPNATRGVQYLQTLTVSGATLPVQWTATGNLPPGVSLGASGTGQNTLSGVPTAIGTYSFTVFVSDNSNPQKQSTTPYTIIVQ